MAKITEQIVERAKLPDSGQTFIRDEEQKGFALRLTRGARTFIFEGRIKGRPRRITIGKYPKLSVSAARKAAQEIAFDIWHGNDPAEARKEAREAETFGDLETAYIERHAVPHKRESSVAFDRLYLAKYIPESWRKRHLSDISRDDVQKLHAQLGRERGNYAANHAFRLLRSMFNKAREWEMLKTDNPAAGIKAFKETKRKRFLKPDELQKLNAALLEEKDWRWHALFPLLLYTGARLSEVLFAEWPNVDLKARTIRFPMTKDGDEHTVPLAEPAITVLNAMPAHEPKAPLFPNTTKSIAEKAWNRIRERAKITDIRIHDLRHTLASWMAGQGYSLPLIGKTLNHAQTSTTERYAHLDLDPVRNAIERTGALLAAASQTPAAR
jgi:integrase